MPYKVSGNWVMIKKGGRWMKLKEHPNPALAEAHAKALNANVIPKEKRIVSASFRKRKR